MFPKLAKQKVAGLLLVWVAALVVVAWLVYAGRQVALERGQRATAAFAAVVEQQVSRTFQALYLTLGAVGDAYHLGPRPDKNDAEFQHMLSRRLQDLPFVRALFVIAPDGWVIHDTDYPRTPLVPLAERAYFLAYKQDPAFAEMAWPPVLSRSGTGWFLPVTRSLGRADGFEGVVVAAVQAAHFEAQFRAVGLPGDYLVSLAHMDGTLVASYPALPGDVGRSYPSLSMDARLRERNFGSFWTGDDLLAGERIVSYRAVAGAPFVVRVSRGADDLLSEWRRTATAAALAMLGLTFFAGWVMIRLGLDAKRRARERERRAQTEKLEALGQLSAGMAHDFANLLNVAGMSSELLRANPGNPAIGAHALASLDRAVRGGRQVAERLLAFARRKPLALQHVRLDAWLETARPLLAQAAGPRVALELESEPGLPDIVCDTGELDVALVNLLVNARDAMAGSGRVSLRAYACTEDSGAPRAFVGKPPKFVCLTVRDNGPGMAEDVRRRALEPFYTTKGEAGTGLGLSQVYGFMRQLKGEITIDSRPGHGTAIHLIFPAVSPAPDASKPGP